MLFLHEYSSGITFDDLVGDEVLKRSFLRSIEVIGEAAKNIPLDYREKHPKLPWKDMAGMRNRLIHAYFSVDWEIVWNVVSDEIPSFIPIIRQLIDSCNNHNFTKPENNR